MVREAASRGRRGLAGGWILAGCLWAGIPPALGAPAPSPTQQGADASSAPLRWSRVHEEVEALRKENAEAPLEKHWRLRFKKRPDAAPLPRKEPTDTSLVDVLRDIIQGVAGVTRALVWAAALAGVAWTLWKLRRGWRLGGRLRRDPALAAWPTHVQELDIRPASLPSEIGPAAWALWQQGHPRAALSMLYRGSLSRLVHLHRVPVRPASTEGECLALAREAAPAAAAGYLARLLPPWQGAVYAGQLPPDALVHQLCASFEQAWADAPQAAPASPTEGVR